MDVEILGKVCSFFGHRELFSKTDDIAQQLKTIITDLVEKGVDTFYVGNHGDFDRISSRVACDLKTLYPQIKVVLILSYANELQHIKNPSDDFYLPPEIESAPKRACIVRKNQWVVEHSDFIVAYVKYPFGGTAKAIEYARKKNKKVIEVKV